MSVELETQLSTVFQENDVEGNRARLEEFLSAMNSEEKLLATGENNILQEECHGGIYRREAKVKADTFIVGAVYNLPHYCVLSEGALMLYTVERGVEYVQAPYTISCPTGSRRLAYILTDVTWTTFFHTDLTDFREIADTCYSFHEKDVPLMASPIHNEQEDYEAFLKEKSLTEEQVWTASNDESIYEHDGKEVPCILQKSPIAGDGLFATQEIKKGEIIAVCRSNGKKRLAGRYTNHSGTPNTVPLLDKDGTVYLVADKDIATGEELLMDYRESYKLAKILDGIT